MSDTWICTLHSVRERDQVLSALRHAGIPAEHVTESPAEGQANDPRSLDGDVEGRFWPIADGALSGCLGAAFGAYIGALSLLFPHIQPMHGHGLGTLILGSATICAAVGMITSLIIKAYYPHHGKRGQEEAQGGTEVTMAIHGEDRRESQLIREVLVATGHGDSVHAPG